MKTLLDFLARRNSALGLSALFLLALFVWYYPGEAPSGDAAYKYLQVKDFVRADFSSFACDWPGSRFDPDFAFFPFQEPMAYIIEGRCFYVFPYQLVFVYLPFFLAAGTVGIYLVSLLAGWGILALTFLAARRIGLDEARASQAVWFSLAAYGLATYALGMNEFTLTGLLALGAVVCALGRSFWQAAAGGLAIGIALQFRAESALLGCTIPAAVWLFATDERRRGRALVFFAVFATVLGLFFAANQAVFGHPLGLRGIVFMEGQADTLVDRLIRLGEYWAGRRTALLINTPVFLFIFPVLWRVLRPGSAVGSTASASPVEVAAPEYRAGLRIMALTALSYAVVVPLAVANFPGAQFGERFLFNVYPLLALIAFQVFPLNVFGAWARSWIAGVLLAGTLLYTGFYLRLAYVIDRGFHATSEMMAAGTADTGAVIFRNYVMVNAAFAHFHERPQFLAVEDERFLELVGMLRKAGVRTIAVGHSSPAYRKQFNMNPKLVPDGFAYESRSEDLGNELIELRRFTLRE